MKRVFLITTLIISLFFGQAQADFMSDLILTSPTAIWTDERAYVSIADAITAIGSNQQTLVIGSEETVTDLTIPSNISLKFVKSGKITYSGQLTIQSPNIEATDRQIFDATGSGEADFARGTNLRSTWFEDLHEMFDQTVDNYVTLIICSGWSAAVDANCQVGNNVTLKWEGAGNRIVINSGFELSNIKNIEAGSYQIFSGSGDLDFLDGTKLKSSWFGRLRAVNTWVENESIVLVIDRTEIIDSNLSTKSNISFEVPAGGYISPTAGITVTINGSFTAGTYRCIVGSGVTVINNGKPVRASWFVTSGSGTSVDPWIVNMQDVVDAVKTGYKPAIVQDNGYFEISSAIDLATGSISGIDWIAESPGKAFILLADNSNCSIFTIQGTTAFNGFVIDGIDFDGNGSNQTSAAPLGIISNSYNFTISRCKFRNSLGDGLKIITDVNTASGNSSITLRENTYKSNTENGLYLYNANLNKVIGNINISGEGLVELNGQWGIKLENDYTTSIRNCFKVDISNHHFEYNDQDNGGYGDILIDGWEGVNEYSNNFTCNRANTSIKYINGANGGSTYANSWKNTTQNYNQTFYVLYYDNTTRNNTFYGNFWAIAPSEGVEFMAKVYDAGVNRCLDPSPNIVRPSNTPIEEDNEFPQLSGIAREYKRSYNLTNYLLYSEDLSNVAWTKVGTATVLQDTATYSPPIGYSDEWSEVTIADYTTDWVYQDVSMTVKSGELLTFSIFIWPTTGSSAGSHLYLGIGDNASNFEDFILWDAKIIQPSGTGGYLRLYVTTVATQDASTIRCWIKTVGNLTINVWGAQLNRGKLAPYIPTTSATVSVYPGLLGNRITTFNGSNLGFYDNGSVSGTVSVRSYKGKYQQLTLTGNITSLKLYSDEIGGDELVLKIIQSAGGGNTVVFNAAGSGPVEIIGGAYTLTAAANAVDILTFFYDGASWYETSRAQDVK